MFKKEKFSRKCTFTLVFSLVGAGVLPPGRQGCVSIREKRNFYHSFQRIISPSSVVNFYLFLNIVSFFFYFRQYIDRIGIFFRVFLKFSQTTEHK
uniref:Uncharacterized protein n=1 Tax=Lutzomyia longipalpis TaxID=7200 RepID=A0A7G3B3N7_LUTLO